LGGLWQKFNALPGPTKVLILGAIVVVGVVIYMNVKGKSAAATQDDTSNQIPGQRKHNKGDKTPPSTNPNPPMPAAQPPIPIYPINPYGLSGPSGIATYPGPSGDPGNNPSSGPTSAPGQSGPTGIITRPGTGGGPLSWPRARAYPGASWPL
jgi:hypothetical protein